MSKFNYEISIEKDDARFRNIVNSVRNEFAKDEHKVNYAFKLRDDRVVFLVCECFDENGELAGFTGLEIFPYKDGKNQCTTHCLSVRPSFRGNGISKEMLRKITDYAYENYNIAYGYEICNEVSEKSYHSIGYKTVSNGRLNKNGHRCLIRLSKFY